MGVDTELTRPHTVIQRTATYVLAPVRELCCSVKEFTEIVASRMSTEEQLWDARRKNELTKRQIIAVRQVEQRMEVDQVRINANEFDPLSNISYMYELNLAGVGN